MTKVSKLLKRLMSKPTDFTYSELKKCLSTLGYIEHTKGKTSGSRVVFKHENNHIIMLHKPHPKPVLKQYVIKYLIEELQKEGHI